MSHHKAVEKGIGGIFGRICLLVKYEKFQDELVIPEGITVTQKKHMLTFVGPLR